MNIAELVSSAKSTNPELQSFSIKEASALVKEVFFHLRKNIDEHGVGLLEVNGLGKFTIKKNDRYQESGKGPAMNIAFRPNRITR